MVIKIGCVSFNTKTNKINLDRRTIRGQSVLKHIAYAAVGITATAGVAYVVNKVTK